MLIPRDTWASSEGAAGGSHWQRAASGTPERYWQHAASGVPECKQVLGCVADGPWR